MGLLDNLLSGNGNRGILDRLLNPQPPTILEQEGFCFHHDDDIFEPGISLLDAQAKVEGMTPEEIFAYVASGLPAFFGDVPLDTRKSVY